MTADGSLTLIVGLGNPGPEYSATRHNVGFRCVAVLARRHGLGFARRLARARVAEGAIGHHGVVLARPHTFMNRSGDAVAGLVRHYGLDPAHLLVEVSTPEGKATGLAQDSLVTCLHLVTMSEDRVSRVIGQLSAAMLAKLDDCLKAALGLP